MRMGSLSVTTERHCVDTMKGMITMKKKLITALCIVGVLSFVLSGHGSPAFAWEPSGKVDVMLLSGAGSGTDIYMRTLLDAAAKYNLCTQPMPISYKNDGGGMVGILQISQITNPRQANHNLVAWTSGSIMTAARNSPLRMKDFTPIAVMVNDTGFLARSSACKFKDFNAAIEAARNGERVVVGTGKDDYLISMEQMLDKLGLSRDQMSYIPYDSATQTMGTLLGGHVDFALTTANIALEYIKTGQVIPEFVLAEKRLGGVMAEVPTFSEYTGGKYGHVLLNIWRGVAAPKAMSAEAKAYWCDVFKAISEKPEWINYCDKFVVENLALTGEAAAEFMRRSEESFLATIKK
ncbi:membrane protein [Synergistales bacterium]|nr:membrane protein [Synergistales bacterium]